jgi:hypothetical protein
MTNAKSSTRSDTVTDSYKEAVQYFSKNKVNSDFTNKGKVHAAIVLQNMLETTEKELRMFSGSFSSKVTSDTSFLKSLTRYIESGKKFELLLEDIPDFPSPALEKIIDASKNPVLNVEYKIATQDFINELENVFTDGKKHHFAVSDSRAYRLEFDPDEFTALVNFNEPETASILDVVFTRFF